MKMLMPLKLPPQFSVYYLERCVPILSLRSKKKWILYEYEEFAGLWRRAV